MFPMPQFVQNEPPVSFREIVGLDDESQESLSDDFSAPSNHPTDGATDWLARVPVFVYRNTEVPVQSDGNSAALQIA